MEEFFPQAANGEDVQQGYKRLLFSPQILLHHLYWKKPPVSKRNVPLAGHNLHPFAFTSIRDKSDPRGRVGAINQVTFESKSLDLSPYQIALSRHAHIAIPGCALCSKCATLRTNSMKPRLYKRKDYLVYFVQTWVKNRIDPGHPHSFCSDRKGWETFTTLARL
jgi:hypothetical protein